MSPTRRAVDGAIGVRNDCAIGMPQPPPPPPPPPPLVSDADRRALHELGYLELPKVPEWELLAFCEKYATVGLNRTSKARPQSAGSGSGPSASTPSASLDYSHV